MTSSEAPAVLSLPPDQFWFERLLDASITYNIARRADRDAEGEGASSDIHGLLCLFRSTAHIMLWDAWLEFLEAGKRVLPVAAQSKQAA